MITGKFSYIYGKRTGAAAVNICSKNLNKYQKNLLTKAGSIGIFKYALWKDSKAAEKINKFFDSKDRISSSDRLGEILKRLKRRPC